MRPNIKIFLADDDEDDRDFFSDALNKISLVQIDLTTVNDGEQVLNYFKKEKPLTDFIFLDINMPKTDGIECLKFIKDNDMYKGIPVIMLSTASSYKLIDTTRKYGATAYIEKPSQMGELSRYLDYCINHLKDSPPGDEFLLNLRLKNA